MSQVLLIDIQIVFVGREERVGFHNAGHSLIQASLKRVINVSHM